MIESQPLLIGATVENLIVQKGKRYTIDTYHISVHKDRILYNTSTIIHTMTDNYGDNFNFSMTKISHFHHHSIQS